ncbi:hypothetical protein LINGRAHAP2_LOCUS19483 [Linum grandiflorum]
MASSSNNVLAALCRPPRPRRLRRRRGNTIRLGSRRRGLWLGTRPPVVQWGGAMARMLKRILIDLTPNYSVSLDAYYRLLPFLRPQSFPLC